MSKRAAKDPETNWITTRLDDEGREFEQGCCDEDHPILDSNWIQCSEGFYIANIIQMNVRYGSMLDNVFPLGFLLLVHFFNERFDN